MFIIIIISTIIIEMAILMQCLYYYVAFVQHAWIYAPVSAVSSLFTLAYAYMYIICGFMYAIQMYAHINEGCRFRLIC